MKISLSDYNQRFATLETRRLGHVYFHKTSGAVTRDNEIIDQYSNRLFSSNDPRKKGYLTIRHFRNQKETGPSLLSQRLLGLLLGTTKKIVQ